MQNFEYYNPVKVVFGASNIEKIGKLCSGIDKNALLVSYEYVEYMRTTITDIETSLRDCGIAVTECFCVTANPTLKQARKGVALAKENGCDFIIGLGGGSVMDCAKIIAAGVLYPHDLAKMILFSHSQIEQIPPTEALPTVMIPTLPATGSEMNPTAVITDEDTGKKSYVWEPSCLYPKLAVLDPSLTVTLPPYQTACGAYDIIAHVIEAYFNGEDDKYNMTLHDQMQLGVIRAVWETLPVVMEHPDDLQARGVLMWAASIGLNGWLTSGTFGFTPMHQMGHVLSARYKATHGATLCCMITAWLRWFDQKEEGHRYRLFAKEFFGTTAAEAADILEENMKKNGVQTRISQFGAKEEDIESLADAVRDVSFGPDGYLNCVPKLSRDDIRDLYRLAF